MIEISGWEKRLQHKMYGRISNDDDDDDDMVFGVNKRMKMWKEKNHWNGKFKWKEDLKAFFTPLCDVDV